MSKQKKTKESREEAFFLNNMNADILFRTVEQTDYYFLHYIRMCEEQLEDGDKVYLATLAEMIGIDMPDLSNAIQKLQEEGYIIWETDYEAGKTYVELTSKAVELMLDQQNRIKACFLEVEKEIGKEELDKTIKTLVKIRDIIESI